MLKILTYSLERLAAVASIALLLTACIFDNFSDGNINKKPTVDLSLSMQVLAGAATRADEQLPAEQIKTLRVVIVNLPIDSNGNPIEGEQEEVEVNQYFTSVTLDKLGRRVFTFKDILADRQKRIYFIANCDATYAYPHIIKSGDTKIDLDNQELYLTREDGKVPIEECTFSTLPQSYEEHLKNYDYRIPITAVHTVAVPTIQYIRDHLTNIGPMLSYSLQEPLYLVRAVNKIDITMVNNVSGRSTEVRLKSFTLSKVCNEENTNNGGKSYLFAKPDLDNDLFESYQPTTEEQDKPIYERANLNPAWMRWLAAEAAKTQVPDNQHSNLTYEWLTDYQLPIATNKEYTRVYTDRDETWTWTSSTRRPESETTPLPPYPTQWSIPTVYIPETIYIPEESEKQTYELTCVFEQRFEGSEEVRTISYTAELPRLESLFRNTHVKVNISVNDSATVDLTLIVQPWYDAPEEEWHYTHTVTVNEKIEWTGEYSNLDKNTCRLIVSTDDKAAVGTFTIAAPVNDMWYAYLITLTGDPDAFCFVDKDGNELLEKIGVDDEGNDIMRRITPSGLIDGNPGVIRIKRRNTWTNEQNTAKLQIMVRTADDRYLEANVCPDNEAQATNYIIIQNRNRFD